MLAKILSREVPDNLEELRLIEIKTIPDITSRICEILAQGCYLRVLSLVQAGIETEKCVSELCQFITNNTELIELDISNNRMPPALMAKVLKVLSENR